MKRSKKILSSLLISSTFAFAGVGGFLIDSPQNTKIVAYAEENKYDEISNSLPDYFIVGETANTMGNVDKNIFLFSGVEGENISLQIAKDEIGKENESIKNYGHRENDNTYYFFKFPNSLSLYYDLTNTQVENGETGENLLQGKSIENFISQHKDAGIPNNLEFTPEQLNVSFKLGNEFKVDGYNITLANEGCYTLRIPVVVYETTNGGESYSASNITINYTFMAFNLTTYFSEVGHLPNITASKNMQENLQQSGGDYSKYYFHSYSTSQSGESGTLPTLEFNPNIYQFKVTYTDTDQNIKTTRIEYTDKFTQYDENDNEISEKDYFVWTNVNSDNSKAKLIFNNLGIYDIEISYLYKSAENKIYNLPLEKLPEDSFKNKLQRVYIYGYQTFYADYNEIDQATNQPVSKELKTLDIDNATFNTSADITMEINKKLEENASNPVNTEKDLKTSVLDYIKGKTPVSTNQTPVRFLSNVKADTTSSKLLKLTKVGSDWKEKEETFSLLNQNTAGVYLYIIQYTYDNYINTSGATGKDDIHYQIFFFEVTNLSPTVSLYEETKTETETETTELYTRGFTNKSVYIIDNSSKNPYDADVEITLSAYNYNTGNYYFTREDITSFENGRFGISYEKSFSNVNKTINGKSGLYIPYTSEYANAKFTVEIKATNATTPSITTFTIDTQKIENINARNVYEANSVNFSIGEELSQNYTNESIIFSWSEKASKAPTYGYLKYIPLQTENVTDTDLSSAVLTTLLDRGILPVDYEINLEDFTNSSWVEYSNTLDYSSTISASAVKQNSGFYLLEVFDEAGNVSFEIFLIDKTSPLFVKNLVELDENGEIVGENRSFIANGENIDVPEDENSRAIIEWADKGIYLSNLSANSFDSVGAYPFSKDSNSATENLKEKLDEFFNTNQDYIVNLYGSYIPKTGSYFKINVNEIYYALNGSEYTSKTGKSYNVSLFKTNANGEVEADEAQHSLLIRDSSNTKIYGDEATNYKNSPSGILNFRVTSDASKLDVKVGEKPNDGSNWEALQWANYSFSGYLDNGGLPMGSIQSQSTDKQTQSTNRYKYSYILPTNDNNKLSLTYIPLPSNGSIIDEITIKYYPFEKTSFSKTSYKSGEDPSVNEEGIVSNNYFYYTIAQEPTKSYTVYKDGTITVENGEEYTFEIVLGTTNFPIEGKYVFERTYRSDSNVGKFDFFKRTITFIVDPYNVISPIESVETKNGETALESIVGGDILVSMYSGKNNQNIEISFPRYSNGLNQGSFYSQSSFNDNETFLDDWISVSGNKLPLSLLIPEYKYTTSSIKTNQNEYIVYNNDVATYYGIEIKNSNDSYKLYQDGVLVDSFDSKEEAEMAREQLQAHIDVYKLYAKIEFTPENSTQVTERYHGGNISALSGRSDIYSNGYMKFYKQTSSLSSQSTSLILEQSPTTSFTQPGKYVVTLYQANNRGASFSQLYSLYKFGFKIESTAPEFSIVDKDGYTLEKQDDDNYYTNSPNLTIQWQIPKSEYLAKIDEGEILISGSKTLTTFDIKGSTTAGGTRYFEINVSDIFEQMLNDNSNNQYIDITMQFEGHSNIYKKTTKRIYFDITAPSTTLLSLMQTVENSSKLNGTFSYLNSELLHTNAREYYDYNGNQITFNQYGNGNGVSYSYIKEIGVLNKYYFNVSPSFLAGLSIDEDAFETKFIGIKEITNLSNYTSTSKDSFNAENYLNIEDIEEFKGLYEIVERDWAGNMTVYIVNVTNTQDDDTILEYSNEKLDKVSFTVKDMKNNSNNLYSNTGFKLTNINYNNDGWEIFSVTRADSKGTKVYMTSPWLENDSVYLLNGSTFQSATLSSIFGNANSSNLKHLIQFANRDQGDKTSLYITIYNATLIASTSYEEPNAILSIKIPSQENLNSSTYGYVYPVKIEVERLENKNYLPVVTALPTGGLYSNWTSSNPANSVSITLAGGTLQLKTEISNTGEKLKYTIFDNFGNVITLIQLANIPSYSEIDGMGIYEVTESDTSKTYISQSPITFNYHTKLYSVIILDEQGIEAKQDVDFSKNTSQNITSLRFSKKNKCYTIKIYDVDDATEPLRTIHIRLYNKLPEFSEDITAGGVTFLNKNLNAFEENKTQIKSLPQTITIAGREFVNTEATYISTYSSVVTMRYTNSPVDNGEHNYYLKNFTYTAYVSSDNGNTFEKLEEQDGNISSHVFRGAGEYIIFFIYDDDVVLTSQYKAYMVTIWDKDSSYYTITIDGTKVERSNLAYTDENGTIEVNYLVGIDYSNKNRIVITLNEELEVSKTLLKTIPPKTGTNVYVEIYQFSCAEASGKFAIIYIKPNNDFVQQFNYELPSGASESLLGKSSSDIITASSSSDKIKLTFTPYYGIETNKVVLKVEKMFEGNFVEVTPEIKYTSSIASAYITRSGYYRISLHDSCEPANYQAFKGGATYMYLYFINYIPFVVTTKDNDGNSITTDSIQNAIYNSTVTLKLVDLDKLYKLPSDRPQITVYRNGQVYNRDNGNGYGYTEKNYTYTFTEAGYYQVIFSATGNTISSTYNFMIISKNESRSSFDFPVYSSYYITKIEKLGLGDVTEDYLKYGSFKDKVLVDGREYLSALTLSYIDEKTGAGRYTITICPNEPAYENIGVKEFTFDIWINYAIPPINVSIGQGQSTTSAITIKFNVANFYSAVGDSYIKIGSNYYYYNDETIPTLGEIETISITNTGTYYIQVYTASGQLIYSYKVIKNEPLNAFAIIAIVVGILAVGTIIFITIKLRKRQKVK